MRSDARWAGVTRSGAPGSALPLPARRAVTTAAERGRWGLRWHRFDRDVFPVRANGYTVTLGAASQPWGRSTHASGYLSHAVDEMYLVWRRGALLGGAVRWRCGARSWTFRLLEEPDSIVCPLCTVQRMPREFARG